jgi:nitrogenase molybdenum-iron protein NifN
MNNHKAQIMGEHKQKSFVSTRNACKVCTPLGAGVAFKGIHSCVPLIHGSQGCATYIRRYLISHYREPVDIASTNFTEESAIFGGEQNLSVALKNITRQYKPALVGIASTCLSETIGDDVVKILNDYTTNHAGEIDLPKFVYASTPSYRGTHIDGFHEAVLALVKTFAAHSEASGNINLFPGFLSPADLRMLKEILTDYGISFILAPDYSVTLDQEHTREYEALPQGGTTMEELGKTGSAKLSIDFGYSLNQSRGKLQSPAAYLESIFSVPRINLGFPIGIRENDRFFNLLEKVSGNPVPQKYRNQRGRLVDAYIDGHKYVFGKSAVVYGEEDLVVAMVSFLNEIGIDTILAASGGESGLMEKIIAEKVQPQKKIPVHEGFDFEEISAFCSENRPDLLIGNSKGYYISRKLGIPMVRVGFPVHDRLGGQRIRHIGYEGTQELFDRIVNTLIETKQNNSPAGYMYM